MYEQSIRVTRVRFFAVLLAAIFATEAGIMFVLPAMVSTNASRLVEVGLDAFLLVVILAPVLWWMMIRPLQSGIVTEQQRAVAIMRGVFQGIITVDEAGLMESANPEAERLFGYREDELRGKPVTLLMPERYRERHQAGFDRARSTAGSPHPARTIIEAEGLRKDGSEFQLELSMAAWRIAGVRKHAGFVRDVTARKRTEAELLRLRKAVEAAGEVIFLTDPAGTITFINPAFTELYGYETGEVVGLTTPRILKGGTMSPAEYETLWKAITGKETVRREFVNKTKDGRLVHVEASLNQVFDDSGALAGFLAIQRDVTARKQAEQTLRHSRDLLDETGRLAKIGGWELDLDTQTLYWTKEVYCIHEVGPAFRPKVAEAIQFYAPEARPVITAAVQAAIDAGTPFDLELPLVTGQGRRIWVRAQGSAERRGGQTTRLYGAFHDITARKRLEGELRETEDRYRIAAESVSDVIVTIDQDSRIILFANSAVEKVFGYSSSELLGKELTMLMPEGSREAHRAGVKRYVETGIKHLNWKSSDVIGLHKNGKEIALEAAYGEYVNGSKRYFVGVLRDVTESRLAAEALKLFRALIDRSNDAIEVIDPGTGRLLDINAKGCLDLGYSREELLALSVFDIDPTVDQSSFTRSLETLRNSGVLLWEGLHRRKNGSTFPVEVNISLVQLDREYAVAVVRDITERKQMEDALRRSEAQYRQLVEGASEVFYQVTTPDDPLRGQLEFVSQKALDVTGHDSAEFIRDPELWVKSVHPDDLSVLMESTCAALSARKSVTRAYRIQHADGKYRFIEDEITPMVDAQGNAIGYTGVARDVSARRHLEAQLQQSQKMESVGRLAGSIAHDFNNLLTVINGMSNLVLEKLREDDPIRADVQEVYHAGERAAALTRQLLAFSRQQTLAPRVMNFNAALEGMDSLLRRLLGEDIDLVVVPAPSLGNVRADPGQIEQVVINLTVNARDAMPQGGRLTIETQNVAVGGGEAREPGVAMPPGSYARLAVSDCGVGMDETTRARIFEPFFTTKDPGKGTGLGLSTVYGIVKQSHGFIRVESEVGHGTTVGIHLPLVTEAVSTDLPGPAVVSRSGTETILLAEDDTGIRALVTRVLEPAGYTVLVLGTGEALRLLDRPETAVHLLLSDVMMPGMSGPSLAARLAETRPRMKVLYMSAYAADIIVRHGLLEGQVPFLGKPFTAAELLGKVREVLDS